MNASKRSGWESEFQLTKDIWNLETLAVIFEERGDIVAAEEYRLRAYALMKALQSAGVQ